VQAGDGGAGPTLFFEGSFRDGGFQCRREKCGVPQGCPNTPPSISDPPTALHVCCCQNNSWVCVRRAQMSRFEPPCTRTGGRVSAEWSKCPGSIARRARESVTPLRRSTAGWMSARKGRWSAGIGRRHPVTISKSSLTAGSMKRVWALRHHTRTQCRSSPILGPLQNAHKGLPEWWFVKKSFRRYATSRGRMAFKRVA